MISSPRRNPEKFMKLQNEIEKDLGNLLVVPKRLTSRDSFILKAKATLAKGIKNYQRDRFVCTDVYEPDIKVTVKHSDRALRIMDTMLKCCLARGFRIEHEFSFSRVYLRKVYMQIKIRELRKQIVHIGNENPTYEPTGVLEFSLDNYRNRRWKDGRVKLEDQVLKILATMEFEVNELHEIWDANALKKKQLEERTYLKELKENYHKQDLNDFKNLLLTAKRWKDAQVLREYLKEIEESNTSSPELDYWLHWAKEKLTWYEPNLNIVDGILNNSDQNSL
jgi:hypothetical protein